MRASPHIGPLAIATWLLAIALGLPAHADDVHYQDYVVGGRAVGLGGAYTAISDDASGLWYNPAGIVDTRYTSVDLSANLYGLERSKSGGGVEEVFPDAGDFKFSVTDINLIPAALGGVKGIGDPLPDGQGYRHALAFALLVPSSREFSSFDDNTLTGGGNLRFTSRVQDRTFWAGAGYAYRINERFSVGLSAFYVLRAFEQSEQSSFARTPDDGTNLVRFSDINTDLTFLNGSIMARLGGRARLLDDRLRVGVSLGTETLRVNSEGKLKVLRTGFGQNDELCEEDQPICSFFERPEFSARGSNTTSPWNLRAGATWVEAEKVTFSFDLSFHAPVDYQLINVKEDEARDFVTVVTEVERKPVLNFGGGVEYLVIPQVSVAVGAWSNFSSAPDVPRNPNRDRLPDVDMAGFSLVLGYFTEHSLLRLGGMYSFGQGRDVVPVSRDPRDGRAISFERVKLTQQYIYVFFGSTFRY